MRFLTVSLPILALLAAPIACGQVEADPDKPVAIVGGEPLTEADLNIKGQLMRLEQQAYQLRMRAIENAINQRLLQKAAGEQKLSAEEFLKREVDSKVADPTDAEVEAFYLAQKDKLNKPLEEVKDQLAAQLKASKVNAERASLLKGLREKTAVEILLQPPRVSIDVAESPRRGPADAPVTIVEFSDYQCPYCKRVQPTLKEILSRYGDQVSLVFKDLPLNIHPQAEPAAQAARCAGDQGKFWEYHDKLFTAATLEPAAYPKIAESLGLDAEKFKQCVDSGKHKAAVQADYQLAVASGASSTPSFYINGIPVTGAQPLESFAQVIDTELARKKPAN